MGNSGIVPPHGGGLLPEFALAGGFVIIPPGPATGPLIGAALTEDLTILAAPFTDSNILIPQDAVVLAVPTKVLVAIPDASDVPGAGRYDVGDPSLSFRFSVDVGMTVGSQHPGTRSAAARAYFAPTPIRITPKPQPPAATGIVRVVIYYYTVTPG